MNRSNWKKVVIYGFLTWLVPFVVSLFFFARDGKLLLPLGLMKSIMVVVGAAVGSWFLLLLFRSTVPNKSQALAIGVVWLLLNLALDLLILVPFAKMPLTQYFSEIGLRYLLIPILGLAMAAASQRGVKPQSS